jgi:hypothetical protein
MSSVIFYDRYATLYYSLRDIIILSEERVLREEPDELFMQNINFFVKSYLINICTYLEAYLLDIAFMYASEINSKVTSLRIPHNYVHWRMVKDIKDKDLAFSDFNLAVTKKEISDQLSANPYKTIKVFRYLGIDLTCITEFENNKDLVSSVVNKRNDIIHHNDNAVDITFADLLSYIQTFLIYMKSIDGVIDIS